MNLDCIENSETKDIYRLWIVIDRDNNNEEFTAGDSIETAWFRAAKRLELRVNDAVLILTA